jgi:hypothetical protein
LSPAAALLSLLLVAAAGPWSPGPPPAADGDRPTGTKLGTRDGRKIEPLEDEPPPPAWAFTRAGATVLPHRERRASVRLGYEELDARHYFVVAPEGDVPFGANFAAGLALPFRIEFLNSGEGLGVHRLRPEDWDGLEDLGRTVTWFRWTGERASLEASRFDATTIGRGALVRRYDPNVIRDSAALSTRGHVETGAARFEAFLDDLLGPDVGAARVEVQPARDADARWLRTLALGATWASDFDAPVALERFPSGVPRTDLDGAFQIASSRQIWGAGMDVGAVLYDAGTVALEPWVDASWLGDAGNGQTLGVRLWLRPDGPAGASNGHVTLELRRSSAGYIHGYFDTFYRLSRIQLIRPDDTYLSEPKYPAVAARETSGFGVALEGAWSFGGRVKLAAGYEDAAGVGARAAFVHGEARLLPWLDLLAAIHRRDLTRGEPVFQLAHAENTLAVALARVKPFPYVWLDAGAVRQFELDRSIGAYRTVVGTTGELEVGREF